MQVSLEYAAQHFDELARAADNGEDIEIARPEKPSLKLVRVLPQPARLPGAGRRRLGLLEGECAVSSEEEWRKMDEELADIMTNGPVFPPD